MDLVDPELEANNACCSGWPSETHSQIFNPDDFVLLMIGSPAALIAIFTLRWDVLPKKK
jgi:hypothetical protein